MDSNAIKEIANQLGVGADYLLNQRMRISDKERRDDRESALPILHEPRPLQRRVLRTSGRDGNGA